MSTAVGPNEVEVAPRSTPTPECDVVMKGGITSGVVYPKALCTIGSTYRIRGIGGASAGAIGAAVGAAAEFGRGSGGFERLEQLPNDLAGGNMATLFQPQKSTRQLLRLMLAVTGHDTVGEARTGWRRVVSVLASTVVSFPIATVIGALPGAALAVAGATADGWRSWVLELSGIVLLVVGSLLAVSLRIFRKLTVSVPENLFGICRGRGADDIHPGFTDWLSEQIDRIAGLPAESSPLRFGQLWSGGAAIAKRSSRERSIDLRMITTCLSESRPYELPWEARRFFFEPSTWSTLFPRSVMDALENAPPPTSPDGDDAEWRWEEHQAASHKPSLRRLPDPEYLPVIVAARLSLSFPLLISAVPLWTIDRRNLDNQAALKRHREAREAHVDSASSDLVFSTEWFTDGGFCSNFPVHLFDSALASRPTFAINLGRFAKGKDDPDPDQRNNVEWAKNNRPLPPEHLAIPDKGFAALGAFASAAMNTARNWQDGSHLDHPGFRDRIVRVLQSKTEGGLNLYMDTTTIRGLAERGGVAAKVMVEQFNEFHYPEKDPTATGWDNHRWVRYRALLSVLPDWLQSYASGRAVLNIDPEHPPSYGFTASERELAHQLTVALDALAQVAADADPAALKRLMEHPRPIGALRRIPQI